jgi:hypothetical protein
MTILANDTPQIRYTCPDGHSWTAGPYDQAALDCPRCFTMWPIEEFDQKPLKKHLYAFNWVGGGYNQVHAYSKRGALKEIKRQFESTGLKVAESTLRRVKDEKAFWDNYPIFD